VRTRKNRRTRSTEFISDTLDLNKINEGKSVICPTSPRDTKCHNEELAKFVISSTKERFETFTRDELDILSLARNEDLYKKQQPMDSKFILHCRMYCINQQILLNDVFLLF